MRISDWSSDVCSSDVGAPWKGADLSTAVRLFHAASSLLTDQSVRGDRPIHEGSMHVRESTIEQELIAKLAELKSTLRSDIRDRAAREAHFRKHFESSEDPRVGNECVSKGRTW